MRNMVFGCMHIYESAKSSSRHMDHDEQVV